MEWATPPLARLSWVMLHMASTWSTAGGSALLAPDTAEALNKAREFVEQGHAGATPGRGRAAGAVEPA